MRKVVAGLVICIVLAAVPAALADADPPSDVLFTTDVYLPYGPKPSASAVASLQAAVAAAKKAHHSIKVALIASKLDLGGVPSLYGKPHLYARFLGSELQFVYKSQLLVVMAQGFGVSLKGQELASREASLASIHIGPGVTGLVKAATAAVKRLS